MLCGLRSFGALAGARVQLSLAAGGLLAFEFHVVLLEEEIQHKIFYLSLGPWRRPHRAIRDPSQEQGVR